MPADIQPANLPVIVLFNIDPDWTQNEKDEAIRVTEELACALGDRGHRVIPVCVTDDLLDDRLAAFDPSTYIVFNWCESLPGIRHSEWLVARRLERLGFTFTGADSDTLALSQDKYRVKLILDQAGIPTPVWRVCHTPAPCDWSVYPAIVKPVYEHCSAGITPEAVVQNATDLVNRIAFIKNLYDQDALVEDFIDGREFHVSVWGNDEITVLPAAEMDFTYFKNVQDRLCTYDAKFEPGSKHYEKIETLLPAPLTENEILALETVCQSAYRALGCRDYARMDVRLRDGIFYVLDVNPNADISSDASMACAAQELNISYGQMGSLIVRMAASRHPLLGRARRASGKRALKPK